MNAKPIIDVIIPAYNEEQSIGLVVDEIPREWVRNIVVANNNSTDRTGEVAEQHGAKVVFQPESGYGHACLKAMEFISEQEVKPDIIVFLDGDHSDYPDQLPQVVKPIIDEEADFVIGSRALGNSESGSMTPQQVFGNWLATQLLKLFYAVKYTDLGPFRAIRYQSLLQINMVDKNYGWTVEMQIKAAKQKLRSVEVPVDYRVRIGESKVSGTIRGTIGAGYKIILTLFKYI